MCNQLALLYALVFCCRLVGRNIPQQRSAPDYRGQACSSHPLFSLNDFKHQITSLLPRDTGKPFGLLANSFPSPPEPTVVCWVGSHCIFYPFPSKYFFLRWGTVSFYFVSFFEPLSWQKIATSEQAWLVKSNGRGGMLPGCMGCASVPFKISIRKKVAL